MNYYCANFYTNISTNMDTTNIFKFLSIFAQNFYCFPQKIKFWTYSAIWLRLKFFLKEGQSSRSLCHKSLYDRNGLVIRNTNVKYENPILSGKEELTLMPFERVSLLSMHSKYEFSFSYGSYVKPKAKVRSMLSKRKRCLVTLKFDLLLKKTTL